MNEIFPFIGFLFSLLSLIIVSFAMINSWRIPIFRFIFLGQFFLFILVFCLTIFSFLDNSVDLIIPQGIHRIGMLFGHFGAITWFFIFDRIENEFLQFRRIFFQRALVFVFGLSFAINFFTISYSVVGSSWKITYFPLGIVFLVIVYGSFTVYQYILFFRRVRTSKSHNNLSKSIAFLYFLSMTIAIISFITGGLVFDLPFLWVFFGGLALFFVSILFIIIPRILLTHEEPVLALILSKSGTTLFEKTFDMKKSLEKDLMGGFLTALDIFGRKVLDQEGTIESIKYKFQTILMKSISGLKFSYMFKGSSYYAPFRLEQFTQLLIGNKYLWEKLLNHKSKLSNLEEDDRNKIESYAKKVFL